MVRILGFHPGGEGSIPSGSTKEIMRKPKPYKRKIHFSNEEVWTYQLNEFTTAIKDPNLKKYIVSSWKIAGYVSTHDYEHDCYKKTVQITPSMVKNYIQKHFKSNV